MTPFRKTTSLINMRCSESKCKFKKHDNHYHTLKTCQFEEGYFPSLAHRFTLLISCTWLYFFASFNFLQASSLLMHCHIASGLRLSLSWSTFVAFISACVSLDKKYIFFFGLFFGLHRFAAERNNWTNRLGQKTYTRVKILEHLSPAFVCQTTNVSRTAILGYRAR